MPANFASLGLAGSAVAHLILDEASFALVGFAVLPPGRLANPDLQPTKSFACAFSEMDQAANFLLPWFAGAVFALVASFLAHSSQAVSALLLPFASEMSDSAVLLGDTFAKRFQGKTSRAPFFAHRGRASHASIIRFSGRGGRHDDEQ